ncbi:MAG TPA: TolC family protein [Tepidisphaeraceae bacterium]|jgi:outer membrane protein TolC|nr:TolC family protein [Tepidisphaeraceae bacterium]
MKTLLSFALVTVVSLATLTGCTVHPQGEHEERRAALRAGGMFTIQEARRAFPTLADNPSADDLVHYALLTNGDLERAYWEWRSAIEQIPQDGTQPTNLALSASLDFTRGSTGLAHAVIGAGNDPMADIVLPAKLSVAARRALENARAAGIRFRIAQYDLRKKILNAYYDYALTAELIRLQRSFGQLLDTSALAVEARDNVGGADRQDALKARNEADLSNNAIAAMQAQLVIEKAALNALLNRDAGASLPIPAQLPVAGKIESSDARLFQRIADRNPQFAALARDIAGKNDAITLAKLQYLPDFSVGMNTDPKGIAQSLLGMVTVPWLRHEAIDGAIAQAEANLKAAEATRRQTGSDVVAQAVMDVRTIRDADRQLDIYEQAIVPRAAQSIAVARAGYEAGRLSLVDLLESRRALIAFGRMTANLRVIRAKSLADLEAIAAQNLDDSQGFKT